ncbi:ABC transporter permease [Kineosporia rhizophila]|uniref:ABC transporter permease n=1 Tax=Kineosporia TaxID=49184 RepID=UPI000A53C1FA|nr:MULTISPECIES: ABC transporter permease [Kineosporia]MCE0534238.1 ABC transporter permease [Kineosporia rhizophila]GLY13785.1 transport permease protein [Kineosporia sp. NBRC 101677]
MRDALPAAERLLTSVIRNPAFILVLVTAPIVLVLIFGFIFGGAITVPGAGTGGATYREFLLPGLLVMTASNIVPSMVSAAKDNHSGLTDRFRSLPVRRVAIPAGSALATLVYGTISFSIMMLCGLAVGWRIRGGLADALLAVLILLLFQFAASWIGMFLGYLFDDEETAGQAAILAIPLGMVSNVFVPTGGMPAWLATIAEWNPLSAVAAALRELFGNPTAPTGGAWPLENPVTASIVWALGLLAVFVPLCTRRYVRAGR